MDKNICEQRKKQIVLDSESQSNDSDLYPCTAASSINENSGNHIHPLEIIRNDSQKCCHSINPAEFLINY